VALAALAAVALALAQAPIPPPAALPSTPLPGAVPHPPALAARLAAAVAARERTAPPRTRHLRGDGTPRFTNRLALEASPYLLQHAHNPVDWYPWGDEAFTRARAEGKPILLSVGYSTCHWCHVMEEESFEDEEVAAAMNRSYVAVKVDREQRPDVDGIYMAAVQAMGVGGGWPMTVWLTSDGRPFYGGTYFPPRDGERGVKIGFLTLLGRLADAYRERSDAVAAAATDVTQRIQLGLDVRPGDALPGAEALQAAYADLRSRFDAANGGFGRAPKFPRPPELEHLLRYHRRTGAADARAMVERTLEAIAAGGIHDQLGGGFHRYATDAAWRVPHFEKMLYDNALLAVAYLEAYQVTGREDFAALVRETLAYLDGDLSDPGGGFWSATDADSEGEEGRYYLWAPAELAAVLDGDALRLATAYWAVGVAEVDGASVLLAPRPLPVVAAEIGIEAEGAALLLASARERLLAVRAARVPPHTDRKVIAAWNGLAISAFARAAQGLREPAYAERAARAASFIGRALVDDGRLQRSWLAGRTSGAAFLDDYAFLIAGLLDLYEATHDPRWLADALALERTLEGHYADPAGGFFLTADDHEALLVREKPAYDGAEPAGNSVALLNLLRLHELTGDDTFRVRAEAGLRAFAAPLAARPAGLVRMLGAVDFHDDRAKEIVVVTPGAGGDADVLLDRLGASFVPNRVLAVVREGAAQDALAALVPLVAEKTARGGRPTAYVCERRVCALPTADPDELARQLARVAPLGGGSP
jgi:uncharacterized protein YyaL (SSP411 family)